MLKRIFVSILTIALVAQPVFAQNYATGACSLMPGSKTCIDSTPCKTASTGETVCLSGYAQAGALTVPQSCWQYGYKFACSGDSINTCSALEQNSACALVGTVCTTKIPGTTVCSQHNYTYQCQTKPAQTSEQLACSSGLFDSTSLTAPANKNDTFSKAALAQEILRQSATYGEKGSNLFSGVSETCTQGYYGIKNCCNSAGGAKSNAAVTSLVVSAGSSLVKYAGSVAVDAASPYVYDMMFTVGKWTDNFDLMLEGATGSTDFAASGPSLSAYGFTYQSGVVAEGSGLLGANTTVATFGEGSSLTSVSFNPYVFSAIVAIQVVQTLKSCSQGEQMLSIHKGAGLSAFVKEVCSNDVPLLGCVEWTSTYCSFNSVLAKTINTQGKAQLGLPVEGCTGLDVTQVSGLDFTAIDFTEFSAQMVQQAQKNVPTNMQGNYTPIMQNAAQGSAQRNTPSLPSYQK